MGTKVDYTKNFIRYSRTETKKFICPAVNTKYDFFQATSDCLIKLSSEQGGSYYFEVYVNDETTRATSYDTYRGTFIPTRGDRYVLSPGGIAGQAEMQLRDLILLLQKGDVIKLSTSNAAGYSFTWTINIYE